jgi:hypothetical protein
MVSEINEVEQVIRDYPYLGRFADGEVVMFTGTDTGVCVYGDRLGEFCDGWDEESSAVLSAGVKITLYN